MSGFCNNFHVYSPFGLPPSLEIRETASNCIESFSSNKKLRQMVHIYSFTFTLMRDNPVWNILVKIKSLTKKSCFWTAKARRVPTFEPCEIDSSKLSSYIMNKSLGKALYKSHKQHLWQAGRLSKISKNEILTKYIY